MQQHYAPPQGAAPGWYAAPAPFSPVPRSGGRGLAITSLVLSVLALLGVVAVAGLVLFGTGPNGVGPDGSGPLTGQLAASTSGGPVAGAELSRAVSARIDQDGGDVTLMNCPDTAKVGQGVVTVCHGVVSSSEYAIVVYFEDRDGRFTLDPL